MKIWSYTQEKGYPPSHGKGWYESTSVFSTGTNLFPLFLIWLAINDIVVASNYWSNCRGHFYAHTQQFLFSPLSSCDRTQPCLEHTSCRWVFLDSRGIWCCVGLRSEGLPQPRIWSSFRAMFTSQEVCGLRMQCQVRKPTLFSLLLLIFKTDCWPLALVKSFGYTASKTLWFVLEINFVVRLASYEVLHDVGLQPKVTV